MKRLATLGMSLLVLSWPACAAAQEYRGTSRCGVSNVQVSSWGECTVASGDVCCELSGSGGSIGTVCMYCHAGVCTDTAEVELKCLLSE